ncbi:MAG: tetratricopeptide repeat protein [Gemmatimonadaceae bacterium]|nr:tetratricopeptide repeat protein [Gemmatimonadaceae bacterium]
MPPSFSAYQAFDRGFEQYLAQQYGSALDAFREAFSRDTTFSVALIFGARTAWNVRQFALAESLAARARSHERDLGTYHEASLRYMEALLRGQGRAALDAARRATSLAPNSRAAFDLAVSLLNAGQAAEAREQLRRIDPERGEMRGWGSYWTQLAHAEYLLGDHAAGLRTVRELARRYPDRRVELVLEARALAAAHDLRQLDSALVAWAALPADVYWSLGASLVVTCEELLRQGREDESRRYGERAVAWLANRLVASPGDRAHRYHLGSALYALGRFDEARTYFEGLAREFPDRLNYRGLAAVTAARRGDSLAAQRWLGEPEARDGGTHLYYRARIVAIAGETEPAIGLLTQALERGVDGFPWVPAIAFRDFRPLQGDPRGLAMLPPG